MLPTDGIEWPGDDRADWPRTLRALAGLAVLPRAERLEAFADGLCPTLSLAPRTPPAPRAVPPSPARIAYEEWHDILRIELARPTPDVRRLRSIMARGEAHLERLRRLERREEDRRSRSRSRFAHLLGAVLAVSAVVATAFGVCHGSLPFLVLPIAAWVGIVAAARAGAARIRRCVAA